MENNFDQNIPGPDEPGKKSFIEKHNISPLLFAFITLILIFFVYQIVGGLLTLLFLGSEIDKIDPNTLRIFTGLGQVLLILVPSVLLAKLLPEKLKETFYLKRTSFALIGLTIIGTLSLQEVLQIILIMQEQIPIPESIKSGLDIYKKMIDESYKMIVEANNYFDFSIVVLIAAVVPAFCEEFLFRGLLQKNFIKALGVKKGIILTGCIFGIYHFNPFAIIPLILLGIYFGFLVHRSGSITLSIVAHFTNNFLASISNFYFKSDDVFFQEANFEVTINQLPSIFVVFFFSLFIFLGSVYFFLKFSSKQKINE
jgi:uncharacterized protein